MSFQECPKCKGSGKKYNFTPTGTILDVCFMTSTPRIDKEGKLTFIDPLKEVCVICNGKMIINTETGKPPID